MRFARISNSWSRSAARLRFGAAQARARKDVEAVPRRPRRVGKGAYLYHSNSRCRGRVGEDHSTYNVHRKRESRFIVRTCCRHMVALLSGTTEELNSAILAAKRSGRQDRRVGADAQRGQDDQQVRITLSNRHCSAGSP